jgi:hypothetical protein
MKVGFFKCNFVTIFVQGDGAPNSAQLDLASLGGVFIVLIGIIRLLYKYAKNLYRSKSSSSLFILISKFCQICMGTYCWFA